MPHSENTKNDNSQEANGIDAPLFGQITIIGLGLIGSSLARGLKQKGICKTIVGCARTQETLEKGLKLGLIDEGIIDPCAAVEQSDLVFLSMPIGATENILKTIKPGIQESTIITDAGSVKGSVIESVVKVFGEIPSIFVPGHPIAGSERSGVEAGSAGLFKDHKIILTPLGNTKEEAINKVTQLWQAMDAEVLTMDAHYHDRVLAATSHLPHLLAYSLVNTLAKDSENMEIFRYAAGGFRDFSRIASSDPVMWHDIFIANNEAVVTILDKYIKDLNELKTAIENKKSDYMMNVFTRAKDARDHFSRLLELSSKNKDSEESMTNDNVVFISRPAGPLGGEVRVPGDKSISHRSIMLGALAEGVTEIKGFLEGEDALATLQAFRDMGVEIEGPDQGKVTVHGVGMQGLKKPAKPLYLGNSGTSMRLLSGLLAAQDFDVELRGDESLSKRPMERVAIPLRQMGAKIEGSDKGCPPLTIKGQKKLNAIEYNMPVASAQVKSCLLLAGLYAEGETVITEPAPTRDHTERMLRGFGYQVISEEDTVRIHGGGKLKANPIDVPADISSSAFFMVAASITPGSNIILKHVGINPTRIGIINILRLMGADINIDNEMEVGGEPVADIHVRSSILQGIQIPEDQVPLAIDEFPVIFIAAACAQGQTVLTGAEELRVKESDRIQVMADGLATLGVDVQVKDDGMIINGVNSGDGPVFRSGQVNSHGDHRIAMAFAVAGLRADDSILIDDCANVATSFPGFIELAQTLGMSVELS